MSSDAEHRKIAALRWDSSQGPISETAVRALHQPAGRFRVSVARYPKGSKFEGRMRAGTCYVLEGSCCYTFPDAVAKLSSGDIATLPAGDFLFEAHEDVVLAQVWELPSAFWTE